MRISDWSSDVCSSDLLAQDIPPGTQLASDPPEKRFGKISNPTVHIGLRQLEKLVNAIIAVHGRPDQIVVELARELKDRKSVGQGKSVSVRVDLGWRRLIKKKNKID